MPNILAPLIKLHRWFALFLAPVFVLILVSGAILACKPIVQGSTASRAAVNVPVLVATLDRVDPRGQASLLKVAADGNSFELRSSAAGQSGRFDMNSGALLEEPGFDVFDFALRLHKSLLIGAGALVEIATYVMVGLILTGLLLGWPKLRNTLAGWHVGLGWLALPLVVITPVTGLLMALHLGMPRLPAYEAARTPLAIARTLEIAGGQTDLSHLTQARNFRRGAVMLSTMESTGSAVHIVSGTGQLVTSTQGPGWVRMLHEGTWAGAWSGLCNLLSALCLIGLLYTGVWAWWRRRRQSRLSSAPTGDRASSTLIAFASQTGTAAKLAEATLQALRARGESVMLASLAALRPDELSGFRRTLLIASTTGQGELPDPASAFMQQLTAGGGASVAGTRFSLLALGDKRYASFCGGALKLRTALLAQGAEEILPLETIDGEATAGWQRWLGLVGRQLGLTGLAAPAPVLDQPIGLQLVERVRLDAPQGSELKSSWQLRWRAPGQSPAFRPGDLLLISPAPGVAARCYSIGSSSIDAANSIDSIDLTVGLQSSVDASGHTVMGLASDYLCRQLKVGDVITAQLRRHPDFNPPADTHRPLILVATGCGIAPFPGFLAERRGRPDSGPVWLFFGNRQRHGDFYHHQFLEQCLTDGTLTRLDTAFSRDADDGAYIQQRIREQGAQLLQWMNERNALIYVCGKASTLGVELEAALLDILAAQAGDSSNRLASAQATLARWKAEGRLKQDLFA